MLSFSVLALRTPLLLHLTAILPGKAGSAGSSLGQPPLPEQNIWGLVEPIFTTQRYVSTIYIVVCVILCLAAMLA